MVWKGQIWAGANITFFWWQVVHVWCVGEVTLFWFHSMREFRLTPELWTVCMRNKWLIKVSLLLCFLVAPAWEINHQKGMGRTKRLSPTFTPRYQQSSLGAVYFYVLIFLLFLVHTISQTITQWFFLKVCQQIFEHFKYLERHSCQYKTGWKCHNRA